MSIVSSYYRVSGESVGNPAGGGSSPLLLEGKPLIVVRAYTLAQARKLAEARLADTTRVQIVAKGAQR